MMIFEVRPAVERTMEELEDFKKCNSVLEDITTHLRRFIVTEEPEGSGNMILKLVFKAPGDGLKKVDNRNDMAVDMSYMTRMSKQSADRAHVAKKEMAAEICSYLNERFSNEYQHPIIESMKWFDPANWRAEKTYGLSEIESLSAHFKPTLEAAHFDQVRVVSEWVDFRRFVSKSFPNHSARELWQAIFKFKKQLYPNLCLLAELVIAISGSNSTVEWAFSLLTKMLSDQRLSTKHTTLNMRLAIMINDNLWSEGEREMIIDRALDIFLEKRRSVALDEPTSLEEPATKRMRTEAEVVSDNDDDDDTDGENEYLWLSSGDEIDDSS